MTSQAELTNITLQHWQYFLLLDNDLEQISRYIEFHQDNYATYSAELVRLMLSACSEIDVVAKVLCKQLSPGSKRKDINDYRRIITTHYPKFHDMRIVVPRYGLTLMPWESWRGEVNPVWWHSYNDVKHERHRHYSDANLENSLYAVAGLFAMVLYLYRRELSALKLDPWPRMLSLEECHMASQLYAGQFRLPDFE